MNGTVQRGSRASSPGPLHVGRRRLLLGAIATAPWIARAARATEGGAYPDRPVRLILPSTIGGTSDLLARLIGARLGNALGQPIVIEARPGAAGQIAVDYVAGSPPDGYTLLLADNGANAIAAADRGAAPAEAANRFAPVTMLAQLPIVVAVNPALGIDTLQELIRRARAAPGRLFYASGGAGSTSYTAAALLFERAGVHLVDVPYAGTSVAVKDVLSGQVPVLFTHLGTVATLIQAGRLHALAVTGAQRMADFPDLATAAESGYPGFDVTTWHGIVAPLGTPRRILVRLHDELVRLVGLPDVRRQLAAMGMEPVGDTPEEFAAAIAADVRQWTNVLRAVRAGHP